MNQANPAVRETLSGVQALRALAATAVAVAHTGEEFAGHLALPGLVPDLVYGAAGVDLFFVISGFVMVYASERLFGREGAFRTFMARRVIRIVPLYWAMTTVMLVYVLARGFAASDASPSLAFLSYVFIPYPRPSGGVSPLYALGWTLNYEMMFYLLFGCALFARRHIAVLAVAAVLVTFAIVHALVPRLPPQIDFWTNSIVLEFVFGMALALLYRRGVRLPQPIAYLLAAAALAIFFGTLTSNPQPRWLVWGVPAAMLVASVALAGRSAFVPAVVIGLGDASYALYLTHPAVNLVARHAAWKGAYIPPATAPWLYLIATVVLSILVAFAVHYWAERPVSEYLKRKLAAPRKRQVAPGLDSGM
jgi:exopolysaccharide production protein ExoZ